MRVAAACLGVVALMAATWALRAHVAAQQARERGPLSGSEVVALVAGNALPENIVHDVQANGLAFRPDAASQELLKKAGADTTVIAAVDAARVAVPGTAEAEAAPNLELMEHIAAAGALIQEKRYEEAAEELTTAVRHSLKSTECGFVVGEAMQQEEDWGRARVVYEEVLRQDPDFPEAHGKLSFVLYKMQDAEGAGREAEAELARWKDNAEAHKNAGLALALAHKFRPALKEYDEALRIKPGYLNAWLDKALALDAMEDAAGAIAAYRKVTVLSPNNALAYYNLGVALDKSGDTEGAIRAYREAKRCDPKRFDARQNLGRLLMFTGRHHDSVAEFQELVKMYPDAEMARVGLAMALFRVWDFAGAEAEDRKAIEMDPTDAYPHVNLGDVREEQERYDEAAQEFIKAEQLDPQDEDAYRGATRVLVKKSDFANAVKQGQLAERVAPGDANIHELYAKALAGAGRLDEAIAEFRQSVSLDGKQVQVMLELADTLEKKGDWAAAEAQYKKASLADASVDYRTKMTWSTDRNPQKEYEMAQDRLKQHLTALRAAGKGAEAEQIEAAIRNAESNAGLSEQLDAALKAGFDADQRRDWDDARRQYRHAVELAEKMRPHDVRLVAALDHLGNQYLGSDAAEAQKDYEQELKAAEEIFGPQSGNLVGPLQSLGRNALFQKDYPTAERFYSQALDMDEKVNGEGSDKVAKSLLQATTVYFAQKDYARAEPHLLRAIRIEEGLVGADGVDTLTPRAALCTLYEQWGQAEKLAACDRRLLTVLEKQYGANSQVLVKVLVGEAKALRDTGKKTEADQVEKRVAQIRAAITKTN